VVGCCEYGHELSGSGTMDLVMSHFRLQILLWSPGKGRSKSKTRRPEFLSSQVGNPVRVPC
jgi:hypothetical protein